MYDSDQKEEDQKEEDQKYYYSDDGEYQEYYYSDDSSAISNKKRDLTDFIDQNDQNLPEESFKQSKANNTRRCSPQVLLCDSNNNILSSGDSVCQTVERDVEVARHHSLSAHILQQKCIALKKCPVSHTSSNMSAHVSSSLVENITGALTLAIDCHKALESSYKKGIDPMDDLLKDQRDMLNRHTDELVSLVESHLLHNAYNESILKIHSKVHDMLRILTGHESNHKDHWQTFASPTFYGQFKFKNFSGHASKLPYSIHSMEQIETIMDEWAQNAADQLKIPRHNALVVLRNNKWDKDLAQQNVESLSKTDHQEDNESHLSKFPSCCLDAKQESVASLTCEICCNDDLITQKMYAIECGHYYCRECWRRYIETSMETKGQQCVSKLTCPYVGCGELLTERDLEILVSPELFRIFRSYQIRDFVEGCDKFAYCRGVNCDRIIHIRQSTDPSGKIYACCDSCQTEFCAGCGLDRHFPATCEMFRQWGMNYDVLGLVRNYLLIIFNIDCFRSL